ncbi:MAG: GntR family transcriptional regulator [Anaerolineales bacterium]|nr:GntR family transcriptional regulator [Anaerolineales bacterium]
MALLDIVHELGEGITRKQPLSRVLGDKFRTLMQQSYLTPGTQLPPEPEMAEALGISRMTLRSALNILEREGTIVRRQGRGTFLTDQLLLPNRLDLNLGVAENIKSMGMEPGVRDIKVKSVPANEQMAGHLDVPERTELIKVDRTRTASGKPVVVTYDLFPRQFLESGRAKWSMEEFEDILHHEVSLYKIMEEHLGKIVDYGVARLKPTTADEALIQRLDVTNGSLLMYVEQIDYDDTGTPLLVSYEYHVPEVYEFTVYRKR